MSLASQIILRTAAAFAWARSEITSLSSFIREPTSRQQCVEDPRWALRAIYLSLLVVVLIAPFVYFINSLQDFLEIEESRPAIIDVTTLASVVFFAPVLEELLFRAGLRNPLYSFVIAPVVTMAILIDSEQRLYIFAVFLVIIGLITTYHRNLFFGFSHPKIENLHSQKFRIVFWANCIYFACAHLNNFNFSGAQVALFWLVITPQLAFAVVFSYLRLRDGVKSSILSHATINLIGLVALTA